MTAASRRPPHTSTHILPEFSWSCGKGPVRHQGKVMVNGDSQEQDSPHLGGVDPGQHTQPDDFQEEMILELEIDGNELLDMERDGILDARVKELLVDCYKPMRS